MGGIRGNYCQFCDRRVADCSCFNSTPAAPVPVSTGPDANEPESAHAEAGFPCLCCNQPTPVPAAGRELDVEAERLLRECKRFMEDMHAMPVEWTIKESQVLHQKVSNALAARRAAQATQPESAPVSTDVQNQNPGV